MQARLSFKVQHPDAMIVNGLWKFRGSRYFALMIKLSLVLFLMPAAVGGARAEAVPVDVGALGTKEAVCDEDPPFAMVPLCLPTTD